MSHQCLLRLTPYVIGVYYPQHPTTSTAKSATFWWLMGNQHQPTSQEKTKLILVEYTLDIAWHGYSSAFCGLGSVVCCEETGFQRPQPTFGTQGLAQLRWRCATLRPSILAWRVLAHATWTCNRYVIYCAYTTGICTTSYVNFLYLINHEVDMI